MPPDSQHQDGGEPPERSAMMSGMSMELAGHANPLYEGTPEPHATPLGAGVPMDEHARLVSEAKQAGAEAAQAAHEAVELVEGGE